MNGSLCMAADTNNESYCQSLERAKFARIHFRFLLLLPLSQNISSKFAIGGASEMKQKSNYKNKAIGRIDVEKRGNVWKWHHKSFLN